MSALRDLVFVSAGLDLDGGGRALAGRLLAGACAGFARERGLGFEVLALGRSGGPADARYFGEDQRGLALRVWQRQWRDRRAAYVFDLLGPARIQAFLPSGVRAPYLVALHGIEVWRPLSWDRRRALARAAVQLAFSSYTVERAWPFCPRLDRLASLPLALEERERAGPVDEALLGRLGEGFLLIVGRMASGERYKGHDQMLEAMPRLPDTRLVVVGDGDDRRRLEARAAALGLNGSVIFTGFVSETTLAELYRRCSVFVMPSTGEGFGLVYLEAMRAGKPCVAARGSAAEEIVVDGTTGLLVSQEPGELASAVGTLLREPELGRRMGEAGHRRWRDELGADRFQERLRPVLERLTCAA
ncbi:MAG TPA: glycosyltransferase family 4 protein [Thermoanaerobaculia bacterium]